MGHPSWTSTHASLSACTEGSSSHPQEIENGKLYVKTNFDLHYFVNTQVHRAFVVGPWAASSPRCVADHCLGLLPEHLQGINPNTGLMTNNADMHGNTSWPSNVRCDARRQLVVFMLYCVPSSPVGDWRRGAPSKLRWSVCLRIIKSELSTERRVVNRYDSFVITCFSPSILLHFTSKLFET